MLVLVDTARLAAARLGDAPRLDAQIEATLLLAALASRAGDRVDVVALDDAVRACAAAGTHYCDLTGEVLFVRQSAQECHEAAQASGARIVHAVGFDSIPSDLGVWQTAKVAAEAANTVASVVSAATTPIVAAENHPGWQTGSDKGLCSM